MRVLLILGHPRKQSLCGALYDAFRAGMREAGVDYREIIVADLRFDPDVHQPSPNDQPQEPDIARAQDLVAWADHLVFIYPTWWGTLPARMKGFLDRVLTPGFAFRHRPDGDWTRLLTGKTAQLLTTMDTPPWVYRWIYGSPGHRALASATLGFCGVRTVRKTVFGPVSTGNVAQRKVWLEQARNEGRRLHAGPLVAWQRGRDRALAWLKALRLQFYPMTWIAYTMGALAAARPGDLDLLAFWLGYLALFLLEAATVFCNDYFDFDSDRQNVNAGPFNGGSRVLVEGLLTFGDVRKGIFAALGGYMLVLILLIRIPDLAGVALIGAYSVLAILALGYTVPPLKLSYRGLGELDVALTHSVGVIVPGYLIQGGALSDPVPWLLSLTLLLSVLPSIILSGVPDFEADQAAGKRTLVVKLGKRGAAVAAMLAAAAAAGLVSAWQALGLVGDIYGALIFAVLPHAAWLLWRLNRFLHQPPPPGRIDGLMVLSITFILWFGVVPLLRLW
ncbi:MAG: NAD(P)H-dependent oxidoreductase [Burkholderiales bacterium]